MIKSQSTAAPTEPVLTPGQRVMRWRRAHPEKRREQTKRYNQTHKKQNAEKAKRYRLRHPERIKVYKEKYHKLCPEKEKQRHKKYYLAHKEERIAKAREWARNNREKANKHSVESRRKFRLLHPEIAKEKQRTKMREWRRNNPEKNKEILKQCRRQNPVKYREMWNRYAKTLKGKKAKHKRDSKRKELGYNILNEIFENSEGHHIDKTNVVFIPKELHNAVPHKQSNEEQMKIINLKAWDYLEASVL